MQSGANALCPLSLACVQRQVEDWTWPDSTHLNVLNWEKQVPLVHIWKNCNSFWKFTVKANVLCDIHMFTPSGQVTRQLKVYAWSSANRPLNLSIKTMTTSAINHMTTPPSGPVTNLLSLKRFTCWWNCATNWPITCRPKGATEPPTCWCHLPGWPMVGVRPNLIGFSSEKFISDIERVNHRRSQRKRAISELFGSAHSRLFSNFFAYLLWNCVFSLKMTLTWTCSVATQCPSPSGGTWCQ